ncbi:hypothetical protein C8E00_10648 [Chromohalobacter marismortui]|uniref:Uncharacterized protein n=1 Tax=Chromohalobacter marismortui TaxID=42055 RepID=A0A4R7NIY1_9GAMM|nr:MULTISPECIES: hypothetical protein [Chromohalobacter]MCI0511457.1 hypothetical protein [Chromohalobacter sp.]MCI0592446.1 hypothetical protein [Chromohalobacter sp.]TDU20398.1 hypothetical protein C8E00_10648 [Chromohalobacter marismortui]
MQSNDENLTRQDDELTVSDSPEEVNEFKFGYWPEIVGLIMALIIVWVIFQ